jgi:hypothetical protein
MIDRRPYRRCRAILVRGIHQIALWVVASDRTLAFGGGYAWRWAIYALEVGDHPPTGMAPTLEAAQAAFKAA